MMDMRMHSIRDADIRDVGARVQPSATRDLSGGKLVGVVNLLTHRIDAPVVRDRRGRRHQSTVRALLGLGTGIRRAAVVLPGGLTSPSGRT
jgi:hypothetical protein